MWNSCEKFVPDLLKRKGTCFWEKSEREVTQTKTTCIVFLSALSWNFSSSKQTKQTNKQTWDSCLARSVCFKSASFFITEDSLLSTSRCMKYENNHHFKIIVNVVFSTFYLMLHQLATEQEIEAFKKLSPWGLFSPRWNEERWGLIYNSWG